MALKINAANTMWENAQTQTTTSVGKLRKLEHFQELAAKSGWHKAKYPGSGTAHQYREKPWGGVMHSTQSTSLQNLTHREGL